jgi:predicted tellurium resistance membrane protein TerC
MWQGAVKRLCNRSKSCHVRKVARLLAQALRPLYFMLAGMIERFVYLSLGLSIVLIFVGVKFMIPDLVGKVPIWISLPFIATVVGVSIGASLWKTRAQHR